MAADTCPAAHGPVSALWPALDRARSLRISARHRRQHARSALHPDAFFHLQNRIRRHNHVYARAELDQPNPLAAHHPFAFAMVENNAPRQQSRDLLEGDLVARPLHRHNILLIAVGRSWVHGIQILALLVTHTAQNAADGRPIHMYVKNTEKDADALPGAVRGGDRYCFGNQTVAGGDDEPLAGRNFAFWIPEKPQEEGRKKDGNDAPR